MSTLCVSWVLHQVRVEPITKMILVAMAENADEYGVAWPSQRTLAKGACVSLPTVKRKLKVLEDAGVIAVRRNRVGKHKTMNKYRLMLEQSFNLLDEEVIEDKEAEGLDPDFEGITVIPTEQGPENPNSISVTPSKVSDRHLQTVEGITCDTFKGITRDPRTTMEPPLKPNNSTAAGSADVFAVRKQAGQDRIELTMDWRPSEHIVETLKVTRGIDPDFCEDCLPDFVIYHGGKQDRQGAFDAKFRSHVLRNHEMRKHEPKPLPAGWQPDQQTIQRLVLAGVAVDFIWDVLPEFDLYWRERGTPEHGWNAKYYAHVTRSWQQRSTQMAAERLRDKPLDRMGDRSWAESTENLRRLA